MIGQKEINRTIGVRLAALMASQNKPRSELVEALGVTAVRLRKIEKGTAAMTAAELVIAAKALGVTSAILTGEEQFRGASS